MLALRFTATGPVASSLSLATVPTPSSPPAHHVIVRIAAAAINPSDVGAVEGRFPASVVTTPRTPGRDFAGQVIEIGEGVDAKWLNKRVMGTGGFHGTSLDGSHAEYMVCEAAGLCEIPEKLTWSGAAAVGVGFMTAAKMIQKAALKEGELVLVVGSSGSVGSAAVQLVRRAKAVPIQTSRHGGGEGIVDLRIEDFIGEMKKLTDGKGVAAVLDCVGEASLFRKATDSLKRFGRYVFITAGRTPGGEFTFDAFGFYRLNKVMYGINTLAVTFPEAGEMLRSMASGFEDGSLSAPENIEEVEMKDADAVQKAFLKVKGGAGGKVVLVNHW